MKESRDAEAAGRDVARALPLDLLFDAMGARLNGPRAANKRIVVNWRFTDVESEWTMTVENGALSVVHGRHADDADAMIALTRAALDTLLLDGPQAAASIPPGDLEVSGDGEKLGELLGLFDPPDPSFEIVAP